jgi:hypothetical protein
VVWQAQDVASRAVPINDPELNWTAGAPVPVVVSTERKTLFAFEHQDGSARIAEVEGCTIVRFGFPNDEARHGMPLWDSGLTFYGAHTIEDSAWIEELRQIEAVHDRASGTFLSESSHFVLLFHDSTLEAVGTRIRVTSVEESVESAIVAMAQATATSL